MKRVCLLLMCTAWLSSTCLNCVHSQAVPAQLSTVGLQAVVNVLDTNPPPTSNCVDKELIKQRNDLVLRESLSSTARWHGCNMFNLWETVATCPHPVRVGWLGEGGKWTCYINKLKANPNCIIYSFGSNGDTGWETALHTIAPNCKFHVFDPTPGLTVPSNEWMTFHVKGLSGSEGNIVIQSKSVPVSRLSTIMSELGHKYVDVLKVDIEGSEWPFFHDILQDPQPYAPFDQLLLEIHSPTPVKMARVFSKLETAGLYAFHREPNWVAPCIGIEYSFAKFGPADCSE